MENFGEVFSIMQSSPQNKRCMDCKKPYPLFASVNNGIFLCESCANVHREFGKDISYIVSLKGQWDEYLLSYMRRGGNERLHKILSEYGLTDSDTIYKYRTKAINSYRRLVK